MAQIIVCDGQKTVAPVTTNTVDAKQIVENPWGIPTNPEKLVRFAKIFASFAGERDFNRARSKSRRDSYHSAR